MNLKLRYKLYRATFLLGLLLILAPATRVFASTAVLFDRQSALFSDIAQRISAENRSSVLISTEGVGELRSYNLIIAVGSTAVEKALIVRSPNQFVLATFISSLNYKRMLDKHNASDSKNISAVFIDPSYRNQIELIKQIFPHNPSALVFLKADHALIKNKLISDAHDANVRLKVIEYVDDRSMLREITKLRGYSTILSIPDGEIINIKNFRSVVEVSYSSNIGVIGYSKPMVKAGAAAASYIDSDKMINAINQKTNYFLKNKKLQSARFFQEIEIVLNEKLLESLNLVFKDPEFIKQEVAKNTGSVEWYVFSN